MIAWTDDPNGTGMCSYTTCGTRTVYYTGSHPTVVECEERIKYTDKQFKKIKNAIKATKTMALLGRVFKDIRKSVFIRKPLIVFRMLFCKSGYLPKRIRRIRKARSMAS